MSGNFKISKQQIAELKKEINELRQSIEHIGDVLEDNNSRGEFRTHRESRTGNAKLSTTISFIIF